LASCVEVLHRHSGRLKAAGLGSFRTSGDCAGEGRRHAARAAAGAVEFVARDRIVVPPVEADKECGQGICPRSCIQRAASASAEMKRPASGETGPVVEQAWGNQGGFIPCSATRKPRWRSARAFDRTCVILREAGRMPPHHCRFTTDGNFSHNRAGQIDAATIRAASFSQSSALFVLMANEKDSRE
jgi:hypothetical protein